jgi:PAS domain S-box-containing protein
MEKQPDYRYLYNSMLEGFDAVNVIYFAFEVIYDKNGKPIDLAFKEASPATERLMGKGRAEIIGKTRKQIFGDTPDDFPAKLDAVLKTGKSARFQTFGPGLKKYYDVYAWKLNDGTVAGLLLDLTESRKAEEALKASETRLRQITESGQIGLFEYNVSKDKGFWSTEHYRILGYKVDSIISFPKWLQGVHPEDRERVLGSYACLSKEVCLSGQVKGHKDEYRYIRPDGSTVWLASDLSLSIVNGETIIQGLIRDITERKKAEEALGKSEERFFKIFNLNPAAMGITTFDGRFIQVNKSFERLTGYSSEEIIGKTGIELGLYQNPAQREEIIKQLNEEKRVIHKELAQRDKFGATKNILMSYEIIKTENNDNILSIAIDITERKKAEEAMLYDERLLKGFFDSPGLMRGVIEVVNDKDIRHIRDNVVTASYVGLTPKDFEGKLSSELGEPSERVQVWLQHYKEAEQSGKPITWEYADLQDNKKTWLTATVTYLGKAPNGNSQFTYTVLDVTERKRAEEELLAVNERFEMAQRAAGVGVWDWDLKSEEINWSAEMFRLFGLDPKEHVPSFAQWEKVLYPDDKEEAGFKIQQALREKSFLDNTYRIVRPNGQVIWINSLGKAEYGNQGEPIRMSGICIDITMRKQFEENLEKYKKNLEKLVEERTKQLKDSERLAAIGATAGMVGHDIRNPLQAITSDIFLAKSELSALADSTEKKYAIESMDEIQKNVDYINKIVADLQDYSRVIKPELVQVNFSELLSSVVLPIGIPQNIAHVVDVEPSLDFKSDKTLLRRILTNLITNAVQAMPDGGTLTISGCLCEDSILVIVEDTGVGISDDVKPKLFTPMMTTKSKGQGLGLAVVKRLVEALNGTIAVESEKGKGTKFIIELPLNIDIFNNHRMK